MSNRGRHRRKQYTKLVNLLYIELKHFFYSIGVSYVVIYLSEHGIYSQDEKRFYEMPTQKDIIILIRSAKKAKYNFINIPNSHLIDDKYYRI